MRKHLHLILVNMILILTICNFSSASAIQQMSNSTAEPVSDIKVEGANGITELQIQNDNQNFSAYERVKNIAKLESDSRAFEGFTKMSIGAITLITVSQGIGGFDVTGLAGMVTGPLILFGTGVTFWGISDIWYYQTDIEKECKKIANLDPTQRENMAAEYLNIKANQVEQERKKKDIWNLFGLMPKPESQVEKEYREYLEEQSR